jgi:uncharacterized protein (TIGR03000 family)
MGHVSAGPSPGTLVVHLPAGAKLMVGTTATTSTGDRRVFTTPDLTPGKSYEYTLKAEITRAGKPVTWEEKVVVEAGRPTEVTLKVPDTGLVSH